MVCKCICHSPKRALTKKHIANCIYQLVKRGSDVATPFPIDGGYVNSAETQQLDHTPKSGQRLKRKEPKMTLEGRRHSRKDVYDPVVEAH